MYRWCSVIHHFVMFRHSCFFDGTSQTSLFKNSNINIKLIHHFFENQTSTSNSYIIFLKTKHHFIHHTSLFDVSYIKLIHQMMYVMYVMYVMYRNIISHPCLLSPVDLTIDRVSHNWWRHWKVQLSGYVM